MTIRQQWHPSYLQSYITIQNIGVGKIFYFFEGLLCSTSLHLFDKEKKNSNIVKYYHNLFCFLFEHVLEFTKKKNIPVVAEFSAAVYPVFSVTWSIRNHCNVDLTLYQFWKQCCAP